MALVSWLWGPAVLYPGLSPCRLSPGLWSGLLVSLSPPFPVVPEGLYDLALQLLTPPFPSLPGWRAQAHSWQGDLGSVSSGLCRLGSEALPCREP